MPPPAPGQLYFTGKIYLENACFLTINPEHIVYDARIECRVTTLGTPSVLGISQTNQNIHPTAFPDDFYNISNKVTNILSLPHHPSHILAQIVSFHSEMISTGTRYNAEDILLYGQIIDVRSPFHCITPHYLT